MASGRGKNKRTWTSEEDCMLIEILQEIAKDLTWKNDKGFKDRYLVRAEELMALKLPTSGLKATPHIESRWKLMKRKCTAICDMLEQSRFGWDGIGKKIQCEKSVYDEWCNNHNDAKGLWNVSFPHFHAISELMGRDQAIGRDVEHCNEAIENLRTETTNSFATDTSNDVDDDNESSSISRPNKKRKQKEKKNDMIATLGSVMKNMELNLGVLAKTFSEANKRDQELHDMRANVLDELKKIEGISRDEMWEAADILSVQSNSHKLNIFYRIEPEFKRKYVRRLLYPASHSSNSRI